MDPSASASLLDTATTLAITITLWATGIGLGASVRASDIVTSVRRRGLLARILAVDLIAVPVAMWVCVRVLVPDEGYATGLLLVAFAAAGPLGIKLVGLARGDAVLAVGLVVVLEVANLVVVPLWSSLLGVTSSLALVLDILRTLGSLVLAPLAVGLLIGRRSPDLAARLGPSAERVGTGGLVLVLILVVGPDVGLLVATAGGAATAALLVVSFALSAGWLVGGPSRAQRVTTSLVTGVRANGAALAIATTSFAHLPEVALGVVTAGLVSLLGPTLVAAMLAVASRRVEAVDSAAPGGALGSG